MGGTQHGGWWQAAASYKAWQQLYQYRNNIVSKARGNGVKLSYMAIIMRKCIYEQQNAAGAYGDSGRAAAEALNIWRDGVT